jgi:hypothetical protein
MERNPALAAFALLAALVYTAFAYGGIRSPDGELMYRTAESLVVEGDFTIAPIASWKNFGVAEGSNGERYAMYGPGLPLLAAPVVALAYALVPTDIAPGAIGLSYYVPGGLRSALDGETAGNAAAHARRHFAGLLNVAVAALAIAAFLRVLRHFELKASSRLIAAAAFAFASPLLPLSGTLLSEPLQVLLLLLALDRLLAPPRSRSLLAGGTWLALAVCVHVASLLWVPCIAGYGVSRILAAYPGRRARGRALAALAAPLALGAIGLLVFNALRFGSPFDTGRPASFYIPRGFEPGLLLFAWGKGLLVFSPWVVVGVAGWPALVRRIGAGHVWWLAAVAVPLLAYATFRDWHGGFGPGPRYLLAPIAVLCLTASLYVERWSVIGRGALGAAAALAIAAQTWVASGELFLWQHRLKLAYRAEGESVFTDQKLFRAFDLSAFEPAYLLDGVAGPALARWLGTEAWLFWIATTSLLIGGLALAGCVLLRAESEKRPG